MRGNEGVPFISSDFSLGSNKTQGPKSLPNTKSKIQLRYNTWAITLRVAIWTYREHKTSWEGLMRKAMVRDCSWDNVAIQYEQVFEWAFMDPPYVT